MMTEVPFANKCVGDGGFFVCCLNNFTFHWLAFTGLGYVSFRSQVEQDFSPKVPFATEGNTSHRISPSTLPSGNKGPYFLSLSIHFMLREHYFIGLRLLPCMIDFAEMCLQSHWIPHTQKMQFLLSSIPSFSFLFFCNYLTNDCPSLCYYYFF